MLDVYTRKNYIKLFIYRLGKYIFFKNYLFIDSSDFIAACRLTLVVVSQSYSVTMCGLLIAVTCCRAWALDLDFSVAAHR